MTATTRLATPRRYRDRLARLALGSALLMTLIAPALASASATPDMSPQASQEALSKADATTLKTSPNDSRDYRLLTLDNGLTVLLVSDSEADKAAASMNIDVGSSNDPEDLAGLAHFLEHMLFLGTDAYPAADAYQSFINQHGGNHNAFTASQDTNYFFDIEPDALSGALGRFSQFFIAPRFNADKLESERNVVHSEYQARLRDDGRRENDALDQVLNPDNPTTGFSVGSRATLTLPEDAETPLRQRVIEFFKAHYGAGVMHLALVAPQPLDDLEALVRERFAAIPNRGLSRAKVDAPLVRPDSLPLSLEVASLRDERQLRFYFPVPDPEPFYATKPASYIANLLGHEGQGSLLEQLREAGLADGLSAGVGRGDGTHALFTVGISLTPEGARQIPRIQESLFAAIDRIRQQGLDPWRYQEQARLAEQEFRFQQHGDPQHDATRLAMNLAHYPSRDAQFAPYRMDGFDEARIKDYLAALTPDNLLRVYRAPDVEGTATSPWFDAPYRIDQAPDWASASPIGELSLPEPNPYIAKDLSLGDVENAAPKRLLKTQGAEVWHQANVDFDTPKVEWRFSLQHPAAAANARDAALTRLLAGWLNDSLNETLYPARLAGHQFNAYAHARGMTLAFSGWRDRQPRLIERVLTQLTQGEITEDSVERVRHQLEREWRNAPEAALYQQANRALGEALLRPQWPAATLLDAIDDLDAEALRDYRDSYLGALHLEAMAVGDLSAETARATGESVITILAPTLDAKAVPDLEPLDISSALPNLHPHSTRQDSLVLRYLQGQNRTLDEQARLAVLGQLISTPFYTRLRTEQQLGYIVSASYMPLLEAPGMSLLVQSPDTDSEMIGQRITAFLDEFDQTLADLDDATLAPYRQAVHDSLLERDTSLGALANRQWQALARDDIGFDQRERLAERVSAITPAALREAWAELRKAPAANITFDPGDSPSDLLALTADLRPLPDAN
ncbi:insulinase family protein [Halomonas sp. I5-271120]|uniref:insulinase family protein n=1 Tax=Halomonas sp. I5-271120 TaxID=3061632 RepID=UPI0027147FEA|nr:insulinase family protein [Halomonas sp. I5-271120]